MTKIPSSNYTLSLSSTYIFIGNGKLKQQEPNSISETFGEVTFDLHKIYLICKSNFMSISWKTVHETDRGLIHIMRSKIRTNKDTAVPKAKMINALYRSCSLRAVIRGLTALTTHCSNRPRYIRPNHCFDMPNSHKYMNLKKIKFSSFSQ